MTEMITVLLTATAPVPIVMILFLGLLAYAAVHRK